MSDNAKAASVLKEVLHELERIEAYVWATPFSVINSVAQLRRQVADAIEFNKSSLTAPIIDKPKQKSQDKFKHSMSASKMEISAPKTVGNETVYVPGGVSIGPPVLSKM